MTAELRHNSLQKTAMGSDLQTDHFISILTTYFRKCSPVFPKQSHSTIKFHIWGRNVVIFQGHPVQAEAGSCNKHNSFPFPYFHLYAHATYEISHNDVI